MDINQRGSILNEMSSSPALATVLVAAGRCWTNHFATMFRLCRIARSSTTVFTDLLLACYLANANCAVMNIMTALIFIIVSWLHAFFLVVAVCSFPQVLMAVAVNCYFQHCEGSKAHKPHLKMAPMDAPNDGANRTTFSKGLVLHKGANGRHCDTITTTTSSSSTG